MFHDPNSVQQPFAPDAALRASANGRSEPKQFPSQCRFQADAARAGEADVRTDTSFREIPRALSQGADFHRVYEFASLESKAVPAKVGMTQTEFATTFGIGLGTLRHWKRGDRELQGPAWVLLNVVAKAPEAVFEGIEFNLIRCSPPEEDRLTAPTLYHHRNRYRCRNRISMAITTTIAIAIGRLGDWVDSPGRFWHNSHHHHT